MKETYNSRAEAMKDYLVDHSKHDKQVIKAHKATKAVVNYIAYADSTYKVSRATGFLSRARPTPPPGYKTALRLGFTQPGKIVDLFVCLGWEAQLTEAGIKLYEDLNKFPSCVEYMEKVK